MHPLVPASDAHPTPSNAAFVCSLSRRAAPCRQPTSLQLQPCPSTPNAQISRQGQLQLYISLSITKSSLVFVCWLCLSPWYLDLTCPRERKAETAQTQPTCRPQTSHLTPPPQPHPATEGTGSDRWDGMGETIERQALSHHTAHRLSAASIPPDREQVLGSHRLFTAGRSARR